jgi:hypothetical protein
MKIPMAEPTNDFDKVVKARLDSILGKVDALYREGDTIVSLVAQIRRVQEAARCR